LPSSTSAAVLTERTPAPPSPSRKRKSFFFFLCSRSQEKNESDLCVVRFSARDSAPETKMGQSNSRKMNLAKPSKMHFKFFFAFADATIVLRCSRVSRYVSGLVVRAKNDNVHSWVQIEMLLLAPAVGLVL
jgi:hypothetical protein